MGRNTLRQYAHIALPLVMTLPSLFLYGTLRDPDILAAVLGRIVSADEMVAATAPDCAAVYFPDQLYPALVSRAGTAAPGLLLARATTHDFLALDAFEGDQYRRGAVQVVTATGAVAAQAYWPAIIVASGTPQWTLERWIAEHKPVVLARETELAGIGLGQYDAVGHSFRTPLRYTVAAHYTTGNVGDRWRPSLATSHPSIPVPTVFR